MTRYFLAQIPAPDLGGIDPCTVCDGTGLTGENIAMQGDGQRAVICEAFCPTCGAGSTDPGDAANNYCGRCGCQPA